MRILVVLPMLCSLACGGLSHRVSRDALKDVSIENKLLLFDAENDVSIALDEREQLLREVREWRRDIKDARAQIREAQSDKERAEQKGDAARAALAERAESVFEMKIDYLEAAIDVWQSKIAVQERLVRVALARYELAKAKLLERNKMQGAEDIDLADFEAQVESAVVYAKEGQVDLKEEEQALATQKNEWQTQMQALAKESGGGVGTPWAEDSAAWSGGDSTAGAEGAAE